MFSCGTGCTDFFLFFFAFVVVGVVSLAGTSVVHVCVLKVEQEHELALRTLDDERFGCLCGGLCFVLHTVEGALGP